MEKLNRDEENSFSKSIVKSFVLGVIIALLIVTAVVPVKIKGYSMEPTLSDGQYVIINKLDKNFKTGDIVVFHIFDKEYLVKRIIAGEGDKLEINDFGIYINDIKLEESYIKKEWIKEDFLEVIPSDHIYMLGDNRDESFDSRNIGPIKKKTIKGKVILK